MVLYLPHWLVSADLDLSIMVASSYTSTCTDFKLWFLIIGYTYLFGFVVFAARLFHFRGVPVACIDRRHLAKIYVAYTYICIDVD